MAGMIITQGGVSKVSGNPGASYLDRAAQTRLRQQQGTVAPNFNQNLVASQPQSAGFDANAYVANMDQRALNNLIGNGANLAGYGDRLAAKQAAQARLNQLSPPQVPGGMGMGANQRQAGVSATQPVNMPGARNPGTDTIAPPSSTVDYGAGSANDLLGPRPPAAGQVPTGNGMSATGTQNFPAGAGGNVSSAVQPGQTTYNPLTGQPAPPTNPAAVSGPAPGATPSAGGSPESGGFAFRGIGPGGNSVFQDPATGEIFTMPASASEGMQAGQNYALPSTTPKTGLIGAEDAYSRALSGSLAAVEQGNTQGRQDIMQAAVGADAPLNSFYQPGVGANDYQAALSGAQGDAAQADAFSRYKSSPGFQYLLDRSEQGIRRNAAATGGLGGGNVQRALQENAIGLAAQDFDANFNRLNTVSNRGAAAGSQMSGNRMQTGSALANLAANSANNAANMIYGTGNNMAAGRTRAGERIADNIQYSTGNLAQLNAQGGRDVSGAIGTGASQLAQLLAGSGRDDQQSRQALATLLANIATGSASQVQGLPSLGSTNNTNGFINSDNAGDVAAGVGAVLLSDRRLKKSIRKVGEHRGVNIYTWKWNEIGKRLAGNQPEVGVMAQENPRATMVGPHGYLMVDYGRVFHA